MSYSLDLLEDVQNVIDNQIERLTNHIFTKIKNMTNEELDSDSRKIICYILDNNRSVELRFVNNEDILSMVSIEPNEIIHEDTGIVQTISVVYSEDANDNTFLIKDQFDFPCGEWDDAIDCFMEIFLKKDNLGYKGVRWTFKDIKAYIMDIC